MTADLILHTYPWWEMQRARQMLLLNPKNPMRVSSNEWLHTPGLIDHKHRGVTTPNCDTLYSTAWLDLSAGPILLNVPTGELPYWSIAVMDMNTDNIAVMGSRYPNTQTLLVCHEDFDGAIPADIMKVVRSKTMVVWLLGRFLIGNAHLLEQAEAMRKGMRISRLSTRDGTERFVAANLAPPKNLPRAIRKDPANFWAVISETLQEDAGLKRLLPADLDVDQAWPLTRATWDDLAPSLQADFTEAFEQTLRQLSRSDSSNMQWRGCWRYPTAGVGNFGANALYRGETALWGLGALELKEVVYASAFKDSQGDALTGASAYQFRIPKEGIPAQAFWSLTMYEVDPKGGLYFTENKLQRYAIGDRTDGLLGNTDGSIDIVITHVQPHSAERRANWLPAPAGRFCLMLRAYAPSMALQMGKTDFPNINKLIEAI